MRGPLPLDDADFAAIRAKVMAKIESRRPPVWRFVFATAAVAVIVISIVVARQPAVRPSSALRAPSPALREKEAVGALREKEAVGALREKEAVAVAVAAPAATAPLSRDAGEGGRRAKRGGRVRVAQSRVGVAQKREAQPVAVARIELQTSDPDVRIIWITN